MLEEFTLLSYGEGFPFGCRIHESLEAIAQFQQEVVGVEIFDLVGQAAHQRRLARHAHMVGELAVELIELIPKAAIALNTFSQAVHAELGFSQGERELGGVIERLVQMLEFAIPVALPPLADPDCHITARGRTGRHRSHQVADDLLVDQAKIIEFDQLTEIPLSQILLYSEHLGTFRREGLETIFELTTVLPTLEKYQSVTGQIHLTVAALSAYSHCIARLEELNGEITDARLGGPVAIAAGHLLPEETVQTAPPGQLNFLISIICKFLQ